MGKTPRSCANGTGPYRLRERQPNVRTTFVRNGNYWGKIEGNVSEVIFTPIGNDATRVAALLSGQIDLLTDPAPQDVVRLKQDGTIKVIEGAENRTMFFGLDQARDELLYGQKGKNPFKDVRVRKALYQAIDIETIRRNTMRNLSIPAGTMIAPSVHGALSADPTFVLRHGYTYSGHATACAAALACIEITEQGHSIEVSDVGGQRTAHIGRDVLGRGLASALVCELARTG